MRHGFDIFHELAEEVIRAVIIERQDTVLRISWPTSFVGFVLEQADAFPATQWAAASLTPVVEHDQNVVAVESMNTAKFFRLRNRE